MTERTPVLLRQQLALSVSTAENVRACLGLPLFAVKIARPRVRYGVGVK